MIRRLHTPKPSISLYNEWLIKTYSVTIVNLFLGSYDLSSNGDLLHTLYWNVRNHTRHRQPSNLENYVKWNCLSLAYTKQWVECWLHFNDVNGREQWNSSLFFAGAGVISMHIRTVISSGYSLIRLLLFLTKYFLSTRVIQIPVCRLCLKFERWSLLRFKDKDFIIEQL